MEPAKLRYALATFKPTDIFWRHPYADFAYSDGVKFLAEEAGAFWILDSITALQKRARKKGVRSDFQIWELRVDLKKKSGVLICFKDEGEEAFRDRVILTEFPLSRIRLYLEDNILLLPSER